MTLTESNTVEQMILGTTIMLGGKFCPASWACAAHDNILHQPGDAMVELWLRGELALRLNPDDFNEKDALYNPRDNS
jgi:hypothetical protein